MAVPIFHFLGRLWRNLPLMVKGVAGLGLPIAILIVGLHLYTKEAQRNDVEQGWVTHTHVVRAHLQGLSAALISMESAARGNVISPQEEFSRSYAKQKGRVLEEMRKIAELVSDNQAQVGKMLRLRLVVLEKIAAMEALLGTAEDGPSGAVQSRLLHSAAAMKPVEAMIAEIDATEEHLEWSRLQQAQNTRAQASQVVGLTVSAGLLAIIGSSVLLTRSIRRRMKALQLNARALRTEMPLVAEPSSNDEIGQLQAELEQTSEIISSRTQGLRASEGQLRTILDNTKAVVYIKDLDSRYVLVNCEYERIFGLNSEDVIGRSPVALFGEALGGELRANDLTVLSTRKPAQFVERIRRGSQVLTYLSVKVPLLDPKGEPYGVCGISTDITVSQAIDDTEEQAAGESGASKVTHTAIAPSRPALTEVPATAAAKGDLAMFSQVAGSVAHDFNNILTSIVGYSALLLADVHEDDRQTSPAAKILAASQRAVVLTKQLFALDRTVPTRIKVLEMETVLKGLAEMAEPLISDHAVSVRVEPSAAAGRVKADRAQLEQLLLNLVTNARDAMPTGGTISVSAAAVTLQPSEERPRGGEFVAISVRDEGMGIPATVQDRMYEPFFTTKRAGRGTGLGLTISAMIAQQAGGWLSCKSEVGIGSAFTLYLPWVNETVSPEEKPRETMQRGRESVLVVEDETMIGEMEALVLRNLGYKVIVAGTSDEAESAIAEAGAVDLVLTDLQLPDGDGRELIQRIRRSHPATKFILTSGQDLSGARYAQPHAVTCLPKPFEIKTLAQTVRNALDN